MDIIVNFIIGCVIGSYLYRYMTHFLIRYKKNLFHAVEKTCVNTLQINKISKLLVECTTGSVFLIIYLSVSHDFTVVYLLVLSLFLILISCIDYAVQIIPNKHLIEMTIIGLVFLVIQQILIGNPDAYTEFYRRIGNFLFGGCIFYVIYLLSKGGMGFGDVKFAAVAGIWLDIDLLLLAFLCAFLLGSIIGIFLIIFKIKKHNDALPFAPFLSIGIFISSIYGNGLLAQYMELLYE